MPDISSIGHGSVGPIDRAARPTNGQAAPVDGPARDETRLEDRVELSEHARLLTRLRQLPDVRLDLIEQVRTAIVQGAYESPEKLESAVERLLEDLP